MGVNDPETVNDLSRVKLNDVAAARAEQTRRAAEVPLPSVGRTVHYYGWLTNEGVIPPTAEEYPRFRAALPLADVGPFAALVVDVGPGPTTVTLKITDRTGKDHVRANVAYGDPGWMWPPRVG